MSDNGAPRKAWVGAERSTAAESVEHAPEGIVLADALWASEDAGGPRISAFIWGGKVRPTPILPFGRWKGAA